MESKYRDKRLFSLIPLFAKVSDRKRQPPEACLSFLSQSPDLLRLEWVKVTGVDTADLFHAVRVNMFNMNDVWA